MISELEIFPENEALPKEWDFIIEPNIELEFSPSIQIQVKYGQELRKLALFPSTLSGNYSLVQLKKLISSSFNLKKNSLLQIFCVQTHSILQTDSHLLDAIDKSTMENNAALAIKVSLIQEEEPCILCVSYECCHSTTRSSLKKRKVLDEHDTLIPQFLEPSSSSQSAEKKVTKRRKLNLSASIPKASLSVSHAINSSFPKQILIKF
jgi:hypothetical protein